MLKAVITLASAAIGFLVTFSLVTRDEIGAEVTAKLDEDFVPQCVRHLGRKLPDPTRGESICRCMKGEFADKGYALTDAFGDDRAEMQRIVVACARVYN